ncbi:MAG TPA: hypothetical protein ENN17_07805 [bacterium]|nr:hypothetical protein [bacterium]
MKLNNSKNLFLLYLPCLLIITLANNSFSRNKLSVLGVGSWDFDISNIQIQNKTIERNQTQKIHISVKTIESTDNTGNVRVDLIINAGGRQIFRESKYGNVGPKGLERSFEFYCSPNKIGEYEIDVEVWGGTGYTWQFDNTMDGYYRNKFNRTIFSIPSRLDRGKMIVVLNDFAKFFSHQFWDELSKSQSQRLLDEFVTETFSGINLFSSMLLAGSPASSMLDAANNLRTISRSIDAMGFTMAYSILLTVDQSQELSKSFREAANAFSNNYEEESKINSLLNKISSYNNIIRNKRIEDIEGVGYTKDLPFGSGLTGYNKSKNTLLISLESSSIICEGLRRLIVK